MAVNNLGKGYFKKCVFLLQKFVFRPENFFLWGPDFCQWGVCSPRRWLRVGVGPIQIARFVSELRPFLSGSARFVPTSHYYHGYGYCGGMILHECINAMQLKSKVLGVGFVQALVLSKLLFLFPNYAHFCEGSRPTICIVMA